MLQVAPMHERRCYVSVAVLDGLIYAIGGFDRYQQLKTAERYDPNTKQWTLTAPMNERRSDASATSLQGRVRTLTHDSTLFCWRLLIPVKQKEHDNSVNKKTGILYKIY